MAKLSDKRGRRAVVLTGIAAGMVLVLGLLYWKDLLARYHLIRLRAAILEPEGSPARIGLSLYLETEEGKDLLARAYFEACNAWIPWPKGAMDAVHLPSKDFFYLWSSGELGDNERDRFIRSAAPFLASLRGRSFRPERHPGFQVTFLPVDEAGSRTGCYVWVREGVVSIQRVGLDPGPPAVLPMELRYAMKGATALLIEPVTASP